MMETSKVSVIIPTHNRAHLLGEAIRSVLSQTITPYELIVIDDGSTDATPEILSSFESKVFYLKVVRIAHTPLVGRVRNAGVFASSGDILAFLDSDDVWKPDRIESQLASWKRRPAAGLAFCNLHSFNESGPIPEGPFLPPNRRYYGRILGELLMEPIVVPSTMMVRRDVFNRFGPFSDGVIEEDYEFILEVAAHYEFCYDPEILVLMRDHSGVRARSRVELANLEYLNIVRRFLSRHPEISPAEKACARQGLANVHFKLARYYIEVGSRREARRHWAAMARLRPWDRRLPGALAKIMLPWPTTNQVGSQ